MLSERVVRHRHDTMVKSSRRRHTGHHRACSAHADDHDDDDQIVYGLSMAPDWRNSSDMTFLYIFQAQKGRECLFSI